MSKLKTTAFASVIAILAATAAGAADLPPPLPAYAPPVDVGGSWYLRGDIGLTNQNVDKLSNSLDSTVENVDFGFDSSPFVGGGVGYQVNSFLRFDATGEYRGKSTFHGLDRYSNPADPFVPFGTNQYSATKSEYVALANVYFDLGNWYGLMPFIGAGVGGAKVEIDHFRDVNVPAAVSSYAKSSSDWNLAWAVHAGLGYQVTPNLTLELAYRYLNLGDAQVPTVYNQTGKCAYSTCEGITFKDLDSHDVKIGMRWVLAPPPVAYPQAPVTTKY